MLAKKADSALTPLFLTNVKIKLIRNRKKLDRIDNSPCIIGMLGSSNLSEGAMTYSTGRSDFRVNVNLNFLKL